MRSIKRLIRITIIIIIAAVMVIPLMGCKSADEPQVAKNVILLIGDGMGFNHIEGTKISKEIDSLNMESLPYKGEVNTSSLLQSVPTDSGAASTAMATGKKVNINAIAWHNNVNLKSVTEYAIENSKKTGIVVTKSITDATPAGFSAHTFSRNMTTSIALQQMNSNIDVIMGEGRSIFDTYREDLTVKGYDYVNTKEELDNSVSDKIFGVFDSLTPSNELSLAHMSDKAIKTLNKDNTNGFFLMIEGSKIDSRGHDNDFTGMTEELVAFDEAVRVAMEFASADGNTMVIVTADHETGDLILPTFITRDNLNDDCFNSTGHTSKNVPYFAYGGMACIMPQSIDNTDIFKYVMMAFGIEIDEDN